MDADAEASSSSLGPELSRGATSSRSTGDLHYDNISISGSGDTQLGPSFSIYTVEGSLNISQADIESLTGPLNVSTSAQGLILLSTKFLVELSRYGSKNKRGQLYLAIEEFRRVLRRVLPATLLTTLALRRAAMIPAVDLVAILTEAVLVYAEIEESLSEALEDSGTADQGQSPNHASMARRVNAVSSILMAYDAILTTASLENATTLSKDAHRAVTALPDQTRTDGLCSPAEVAPSGQQDAGHMGHTASTRAYEQASSRTDVLQDKDLVCSDTRLDAETRAFETELFTSRVYDRTKDRIQSISTRTSTLGDSATTILPSLSLADVSIASVLRLPISLEALSNGSAYLADWPTPILKSRQPRLGRWDTTPYVSRARRLGWEEARKNGNT